jgi:hypothetical protein
VVVEAGVTVIVVAFKFPGFQTNEVLPTELLADKEVEAPWHIMEEVTDVVIAGYGLTVIVTASVLIPGHNGFPPVAVSVYVVVVAGVATGLAIFGFDNPVVGSQE